ncbi:hypothetical protein [Phenylobacterium sp.]|uniref:hypothetical protein n=1 Tax=Phenylobacterium sp. TaxID=1871053 RepID=UPI002E379ACA|nr:hypothetical protein [Phenylobacterium sp.]HEX3365335.1 hypothetical protein [Phenylobacterium sp.]
MSAPQRDDAVIGFFGNAFIAIGWLVLTLGGLCTVVIGVLSVTGVGDSGGHASLEDWGLPAGMLASGGASLWIGRTIKRSRAPPPDSKPDV